MKQPSDHSELKQGTKTLLELGPIIVFVIVTSLRDIQTAIGIFLVLSLLSAGFIWWKERSISFMLGLGTLLILLFAGISLVFDNPLIYKAKPTIASGLFALVFLYCGLSRRLWVKRIFGAALTLRDEAWHQLSYRWGFFFLVLALLNIPAMLWLSDEAWALSKLGYFVITLVFAISQAPFLMRETQAVQDEKL